MKKTSFFLIFIFIVGFLYFLYPPFTQLTNSYLYQSPCDTPLTYKIGTVDERFQLSKIDFKNKVENASNIWNNVMQKKLLSYNPEGELTVNLIYDQRQSLNNQINSLEGTLNNEKTSLNSEVAEYENLSRAFEGKLAAFNSEVAFWNGQGGAPKEEFNKLKKEEDELKAQADRINVLAKKLNLSTQNYNAQVNTLNSTINNFKQALERKPEEGVYKPNEQRIDIYFNINDNELIHTLAHEFGHALGLDHIEDENAIMYPFTNKEIAPVAEETAALQKICEKKFIGEIALRNVALLTQQLIIKAKNTK